MPVHRQAVSSATQVCREVIRQQSIANGLLKFLRLLRHNLPLAVSLHPDTREAKFSTERPAIFVFACRMVIPITNREVLAVHSHFVGRNNPAGDRVGIILESGERGFLIEHLAASSGEPEVVRPDTFNVVNISGDIGLTPLLIQFCDLFRDLFGFASRYRRLRRASGNTSRQSCADSYEYNR